MSGVADVMVMIVVSVLFVVGVLAFIDEYRRRKK